MDTFDTEKEFLASYNIHDFDVPLCTVDMCIFTVKDGKLQILLTKRGQFPKKNQWALPGGFIDQRRDKNLDETAFRKLREKTGVASPYLEQVATIGGSKRDPRGWALTVLYFALIPHEDTELKVDASSFEVSWVPVDHAMSLKLAFDHNELLKLSKERLRNKALYTSLPVHLLKNSFTLPLLQRTYEIILNTTLQKKSFRKRFLDAGIIEETGGKEPGVSKPALLYRLIDSNKVHIFPRTLESAM